MKLCIDATSLRTYPLLQPGFSGGTEAYVKVLAHRLAAIGHQVHLIAPDAQTDFEWAPNLYVWPESNHPTRFDALLTAHNLAAAGPDAPYVAPILILLSNGLGAFLGPNDEWAKFVDGVACFSEKHKQLLVKAHPNIDEAKCYVTGLGVDLNDYVPASFKADGTPDWKATKVPGRLFYSNDPARGLWHVLDIFEHVKKEYPEATLHVGYDFDRQFQERAWRSNWQSECFWDMKRRIATMPGVVNLGALDRNETLQQQRECDIHVMPSDPPNVGSQIDGMLQRELAATGTPLILSNIEAFPEVFGEAALCLPLPGTYMEDLERRYDAQDWAEATLQVLRDPAKWLEMSTASRALAERQTWDTVIERFDAMLADLAEKANVHEHPASQAPVA